MPSHECFSTNWNSAEAVSKRHTITSEIAKVTSVVHSATQRAVPLATQALPRTANMMNNAPTSGRKVTTERMGQVIGLSLSHREHEPGDEERRADKHGEGVVIEVTGLQPDHVARDVEDARGDAVGAEAVDEPAVAALP